VIASKGEVDVKTRLLVVEDEHPFGSELARFFRRKGFEVDEASDFLGAIAQVDRRTYHVALVDLMLAGQDRTNRDGLRVIDHINDLGEGTSVVVMSYQDDPQTAADTVQSQKAFRYMAKPRIIKEGASVLLPVIEQAHSQSDLKVFGWSRTGGAVRIPRSCLSYLAGDGPQMVVSFSNWANLLGPKVPPPLLEEFITELFTPWAPLLPPNGGNDIYKIQRAQPCSLGRLLE